MPDSRKRVLISGAGVAGPALAWWLDRFGFEPTIVEIASEFRTGGYIIDFWGKGFDLVDKMGLLPQVEKAGYHVKEVRFVGSDGRRTGSFSTDPFWKATDGRFVSVPRGALAEIIWRSLGDRVETRFSTEVESIHPEGDHVEVALSGGKLESYDFVIGADGLHSKVRNLTFGPEDRFETFLGYNLAVFTVAGYEPRSPDTYMMHGAPGRQVARFTMRDGRTMILFIWRGEESAALPCDPALQKTLLRDRFGRMGWEVSAMLDWLDGADDLYMDRVSQIHLPRWSSGRVGLVGDAAWAPSFLAGEGTGLAIIGGYVLAGEMARGVGDPTAFSAYEKRLRGFIERKQKMASRVGGAFAPKTPFGVWFRDHVASLLNIQPIGNLALSAGLKDNIDLPDYAATSR